jgi:hypothetical protein
MTHYKQYYAKYKELHYIITTTSAVYCAKHETVQYVSIHKQRAQMQYAKLIQVTNGSLYVKYSVLLKLHVILRSTMLNIENSTTLLLLLVLCKT